MSIEKEIQALAQSFSGMLPKWVIDTINGDTASGEWGVAIHMLCEHLYDLDTPIDQDQWERIDAICKQIELDKIEEYDWNVLRENLISTD